MASLIESLKAQLEKFGRRFEPDQMKRRYYQYLEERLPRMYAAIYDQPRLAEELNCDDFTWTITDLDDATDIARTLCDFGLRCELFDDLTYAQAITANDTDINDLAAVAKLYSQSFHNAQNKANQGQLAPTDLRRLAAVSYHLQSLKWLVSGICPILHSPYRSRSFR